MLRILLLYCALQPLQAFAQQVGDTTVVLPQITVTASRIPVSVVHAPIRTQVLDRSVIGESGSLTVADLLRQRSALYVRHYVGGLSTLSQRGGTASQTLILLDGHRIASPQAGQLDLSLLPTILLNAVEITSGAGGVLYGTDAIGGVVNLQTESSGKLIRLHGETGAWGKRHGAIYGTMRRGRLAATVAGEVDRYTGDYPYLNRGLFPPEESPREGGDQQKHSIFGSMIWTRSNDEWRVNMWYNDAERGLPDINSSLPASERQWDEHLRVWTNVRRKWAWGSLKAGGLAQAGSLRYINQRTGIDNTGRTTLSSIHANIELIPIRAWQLSGGVEAGVGQADHPSLQGGNLERRYAIYANAKGSWRQISIYPALRLDYYDRPKRVSSIIPSFGVNVRLRHNLHLKSTAASAFRMPTFNDRFWLPGGNPSLRPERGESYDAGLIWLYGGLQIEMTTFIVRMRDQIVWQPTSAGHWSPMNVSRATNYGLETSVDFQRALTTRTKARAGLIWTHVERKSDSFLRLTPRNAMKGHMYLRWRFLAASIAASYTGVLAITSVTEIDPFFLLDGQLKMYLGPISLGIHGENFLDTRYEYLPTNPMPPRQLRLVLTLTFQ
ncbi:MAG: TonB-dependent receptor [Bacteroidetes bacterium]|nr:TonB-dependent receptor [Bacteroidota bacterium]MCY4206039.1 TonB-dependent receptor [Bacteroidota bacterium]